MVSFVIYGKPVPKQRPRFSKGGVYTPAATRNYEQAVRIAARQAMAKTDPLSGPVALHVIFHCAIPKSASKAKRADALAMRRYPVGKPDLSNLLKTIEDALNGIVYGDDAQIVTLDALKVYADDWSVSVHCEAFNG